MTKKQQELTSQFWHISQEWNKSLHVPNHHSNLTVEKALNQLNEIKLHGKGMLSIKAADLQKTIILRQEEPPIEYPQKVIAMVPKNMR